MPGSRGDGTRREEPRHTAREGQSMLKLGDGEEYIPCGDRVWQPRGARA